MTAKGSIASQKWILLRRKDQITNYVSDKRPARHLDQR